MAVIDRHLEKNGGATMRDLLQRNAHQERCTYTGYTWREPLTRALLRNGTRVCAEAHHVEPLFWQQVDLLRKSFSVKIVVRVREPFAWAVSYFLWSGGFGNTARGLHLNATTLPANAQARVLLYGSRAWPVLTSRREPPRPEQRWIDTVGSGALTAAQGEAAERILCAASLLKLHTASFRALANPVAHPTGDRRTSSRRSSDSTSSPCCCRAWWAAGCRATT